MAIISLPTTVMRVNVAGDFQPTAPIGPLPETKAGLSVFFTPQLIAEIQLESNMGIQVSFYVRNSAQSAKITALSQQLEAENIVTLWELDLSRYDLGVARFTTDVTENNQPVMWGGKPYYPIPCTASGFERKSQGSQARPTLKLSNVTKIVSALVIEGKDLVGCEVRRIRTFRRFLDDGVEPSTTDHWPTEVYRVNRKKAQDKYFSEFELASVLDQEGIQLPKRQVIRDYCDFIYRRFNSTDNEWIIDKFDPCPYAGTTCYKADGTVTDKNGEDKCGKRLRDCKLRFGANNELPFRGFPGVARVR